MLHDFNGAADGFYPTSALTLDNAGRLYGTTQVAFQLSHRGSGWLFTPLYTFQGVPDGLFPNQLTVAANGALYGTTSEGGLPDCADGDGCGTLFNLRPSGSVCKAALCPWSESVLYSFNPFAGSDGYAPVGNVVLDAAGNIYGTTIFGGQYGQGTVFELTPSDGGWVESIIYSFRGLNDGGQPGSGLTMDAAGNLYGTTEVGGDLSCSSRQGCGTVYQLAPSASGWTYNIAYAFHNRADGRETAAGVIIDSAGNLYGDTYSGGANGGGTVFELQPANGGWTFKLLYSLTGTSMTGPLGAMGMDGSGNLYGVTNSQGAYGTGNVFKLTASGGNWTYSDLHDFAGGSNDGAYPEAGPIVDTNSNVFGTATFGGTGSCFNGCGVVWEITQ
ncbi:MAG: choice-of-anchor tandem repeat GloVer-containing protein [Candidatus Korobacteraceae bacterium]